MSSGDSLRTTLSLMASQYSLRTCGMTSSAASFRNILADYHSGLLTAPLLRGEGTAPG